MSTAASTICEIQLRFGTNTQIDVQLPATTELNAVLADLEPYLRAYLDNAGAAEPLPDHERGWRLRTPLGTLLDNNRSLAGQDVLSGTALELIAEPVGEQFTPRIENVSSAVAQISAERFRAATPSAVATMMVWYGAALLATVLTVLVTTVFTTSDWTWRAVLAGGVTAVAVAAVVNARTRKAAAITDATNALLITFAPLTVSLLIPLPAAGWGPPHLLVTATGIAAAAAVGIAARRHIVVYTALAVTSLFVAASQIGRTVGLWPGPVTICLLVIAVVVLLGRADVTAQNLARLPISMFPSGSGRFVGQRKADATDSDELEPTSVPPDPAALQARAIRANDYLTGLLIGYAIAATAMVAVVIIGYHDRWDWVVWVCGVPLVFAYQAWFYAGRRNVAAVLAGVFGPAAAAAVLFSAYYGVWWGAATGVAVAAVAALAPRMIPTATRQQSPMIRGVRAIAGYLILMAVILYPLVLLRVLQMVYNRDFGS